MATGESKTAEDPQDGWGSKNWTGAGFLPIGLVFVAISLAWYLRDKKSKPKPPEDQGLPPQS